MSKNNPKNRGKTNDHKMVGGKEVEPALYYGIHMNHGKYMAAKYKKTNELVLSHNGKPTPWADITSEI